MAPEHAGGPPESGGKRPQDPLVGRLRPDPSEPARPALTLVGFLGDSDRIERRRLYFTRDLDYYAEIPIADILDASPVPPDQPPFLGEEATRLTVARDAPIEFTRQRGARPLDEFDLDVRSAEIHFNRGPEFISADTCVVNCELTPTNFGPCPTDSGWTCDPSGCECRRA